MAKGSLFRILATLVLFCGPLLPLSATAQVAPSGADADEALCEAANLGPSVIAACSRMIARSRNATPRRLAYFYTIRGIKHSVGGAKDLAIADLNESVRLNPKSSSSYSMLGQIYLDKKEYDRAISYFNEAIQIDPKSKMYLDFRMIAHTEKGDKDAVIADLDEIIRLFPESPNAYYSRSRAYSEKGELSRALADMETFVRFRPGEVDSAAEVQRLRAALGLAPAVAEVRKRRALVIGNDGYRQIDRLLKARGDADAMAATLKTMGFETTLAHDLDNLGFGQVLDRFVASLEPSDTALFFFAGHGVEVDGTNYLLPTDMPNIDPGQTQFQRSAYKVREIVDRIRQKSVRVAIAVIDACRDNPLRAVGQRGSATRGLGRMEAEAGEFLLFSAGPREAALDRLSDSDASPTSVFTRVFVKHLKTPGASLVEIAKRTQSEVRTLARTAQRPHAQFPDYSDRIEGNLVLKW